MREQNRAPTRAPIQLRGVRQNNLKNLNLDIPAGRMTVVTGLSGSGKSSLVFDTLYAEGQRRYVETFSPYARQFLDRMNRPKVDKIEGIPPAIAIDQSASVRTSRSTVGTMSEINDHLKLLFAHSAHLYCPSCGVKVQHWHPELIWHDIQKRILDTGFIEARVYLTFPATFPSDQDEEGIMGLLSSQGFTRILEPCSVLNTKAKTVTHAVVADRFKGIMIEPRRALEAIELALNKGLGRLDVYLQADAQAPYTLLGSYQQGHVCPSCQRHFKDAQANTFSFNSPLGACERCRGFGNTLEVDRDLVLDRRKSLQDGAIPFSHYQRFQPTWEAMCSWVDWTMGCDSSLPIQELPPEIEEGLWKGTPQFEGLTELFTFLESKSYKPHVKAFLNKYRRAMPCTNCGGAHLKPEGLWWRLGDSVLARHKGDVGAFKPLDVTVDDSRYYSLPGLNFHEWMTLPIHELLAYVRGNRGDQTHPQAEVWNELESRLHYLDQVGLGYLTLDRQSRTLSGGEVQRVNLTTALGTQLVNTLFLLDEPSIGLHPRDLGRVNDVMRRLTALGNTLVVVEHDPQVMLAGDELLDLGPGAGAQGGEIVYHGSTHKALEASTLTAQYLRGERRICRQQNTVYANTPRLTLSGCCEHNLKNVTLSLPLGRFVVLAGVSGSGKSTLVENQLIPTLQAKLDHLPLPDESLSLSLPPQYPLAALVHVDQSPIGQNARSTPATYIKVYDDIRALFGTCPESIKRGFTPGDFSFNTGTGRCQTCLGTGVEHVEMQFLSDIDLPCPACHGKRFRDELLEVKLKLQDGAFNIVDVLGWTVDEALHKFGAYPKIVSKLATLKDVGLGYLTLGQPLNTISGGESQRLKLATCLADGVCDPRKGFAKRLFAFDEPTNGLHFEDIRKLVDIFDRLVKAGHSVLVIEHNLDMMNVADWIIEMGPEGGQAGGDIIHEGTPEALIATASTTGQALQAWRETLENPRTHTTFFELNTPPLAPLDDGNLHIINATEHNLKGLSVAIPRKGVTVITGPSGSGKSTLAFDIIFAEGQRRYLESLNAYARSMLQPPPIPRVEEIRGLAPTVAIEQRTSRGGLRSTVATMTEIYHFLRLLYVKLGTPYCPSCRIPAKSQTPDEIKAHIEASFPQKTVILMAPVITHQKGSFRQLFEDLRQAGFSDVNIDGTWQKLDSVTTVARHDLHNIAVAIGEVNTRDEIELEALLEKALRWGEGRVWAMNTQGEKTFYSLSSRCPQCNESFPNLDPRLFSYNAPIGACPTCTGYGVITAALKKATPDKNVYLEEASGDEETTTTCPSCEGTRLAPFVRAVSWQGKGIEAWGHATIDEAAQLLNSLQLSDREAQIGHDAIEEIRTRLKFLQDVGLGYLTLDRAAPTLSGGEAQRIRLAAQLGSNLQGACYILDEPTIGLHARDNAMLIRAMRQLAQQGNTLIVVEHDEDTIEQADFVVDIGPGSGTRGGELLVAGSVSELKAHPTSLTGQALVHPVDVPLTPRHAGMEPPVTITHLQAHNVDVPSLSFRLGTLTVVTGVSGSGKSTLTRTLVYPRLQAYLESGVWPDQDGSIQNGEEIQRLLEVDQTPIGKNPRSCPATYIGFFNAIRDLFAQTPESQMRGFGPERFSFNVVKGGRCPVCEGQGMRTLAMSFMPDIKIECETCHGMRFTPETLMVTWKGKNIGEVLQMQVDEAVSFFESVPKIHHPLKLMQDVGLGYLTLGQPSPTLSGGEAQRIKLVTELSKAGVDKVRSRAPRTLYVLDEPTVGLHMADVKKLLDVLNRLVDKGHTVLVVEHNLDLIAQADCVIDMGPEGGRHGGRIVGQGAPREIANLDTPTGRALAAYFKTHGVQANDSASSAIKTNNHKKR